MSNGFAAVIKSLSPQRVKAYYKIGESEDVIQIFCRYLWNISLSSQLYLLLQTAEVVLRNSVNDTITQWMDNPFWLYSNDWLKHPETKIVADTLRDLKITRRDDDIDHFVSELS